MLELMLLALALAMDAFAVALVRGSTGERRLSRALEVGLAFGVAQGIMPLAGWALGEVFAGWIEAVDHWIAFALLSLLGARMLREAFSGERLPGLSLRVHAHYAGLFAAALATSVDAAAAGLTLDLFATPVAFSCLVIGLVTAVLCAVGYWSASRVGARFGAYAGAFGGLVLIGLGVKILVEHTS